MFKPLFSLIIMLNVFAVATVEAKRFPDFTELAENIQPSVVSIKVDIKQRGRSIGKAGGSGFIIDNKGHILTNHHVVENSDRVTVKLASGREYPATIIGSDAGSDVALLKIKAKRSELKAVKLGSSDNLKVGEWVLAFGAPFNLEQTVTAGIVSAKSRSVGGSSQFVPFIQTDVAINRGNSGGPLINQDGEVVGINSMIFNPMVSTGLSFSIPIDLAESISAQLKDKGRVIRGYLGVGYQEVDQERADYLELPQVAGALINSVEDDSPADKAGLVPGDVVVEIDGNRIKQHQDLPFYIAQIAPDTKIKLKAYRDGKLKNFKTTLVARRDSVVASQQQSQNNDIGIEVERLTDEMKRQIGIDSGVIVSNVTAGSPAQRAGIREGDVIRAINRQTIESVADFNNAVDEFKDREKILVLISRYGAGSDYLVIDLR